jgi:hypothetical protein
MKNIWQCSFNSDIENFRNKFSALLRNLAKNSFGIYFGTVSHVPSLRDDDNRHGNMLEMLNRDWIYHPILTILPEGYIDNNIYKDSLFTVYVYQSDDFTISITYMGTDNMTDIRTDLKCRPVILDPENPHIFVHAGFKRSYIDSRDKYIIPKIKELCCGKTISHLQFSGHSKGGAEATLAAYDLSKRTDLGLSANFSISLVTFGQPPVGNKAFVDEFKVRLSEKKRQVLILRITNQFDPVPKLLDGNFLHHCNEFCLSPQLLDRVHSSIVPIVDKMPFENPHGSWQYIYNLELFLQGNLLTIDFAGNVMVNHNLYQVAEKGNFKSDTQSDDTKSSTIQSCGAIAPPPLVIKTAWVPATIIGGGIISNTIGTGAAVVSTLSSLLFRGGTTWGIGKNNFAKGYAL